MFDKYVCKMCVQKQRPKTISLKQNMKTHWQNGWHVEHEIDKNHCRNSMAKKKTLKALKFLSKMARKITKLKHRPNGAMSA